MMGCWGLRELRQDGIDIVLQLIQTSGNLKKYFKHIFFHLLFFTA